MKSRPDDFNKKPETLTELEKTVEKLLVITQKEREYAINLNGEALAKSIKSKAKVMVKLTELLKEAKKCPVALKRRLSLLKYINSSNLRMFQSILRITCKYRKVLTENQLESVAYSNKGQFEKLPISLKFVGSA